jgi:hypothetical protein
MRKRLQGLCAPENRVLRRVGDTERGVIPRSAPAGADHLNEEENA